VFSDVVMPGIGGLELAKRLKVAMPDLPVVMASGYSHVLDQEGTHGFTPSEALFNGAANAGVGSRNLGGAPRLRFGHRLTICQAQTGLESPTGHAALDHCGVANVSLYRQRRPSCSHPMPSIAARKRSLVNLIEGQPSNFRDSTE
jgi:hypothetical protein